jgi:hypothetical protein
LETPAALTTLPLFSEAGLLYPMLFWL